MKIRYRDLSLLGLLIYLCGEYLGNTERIICFGIFVLLSIPRMMINKFNQYAKWQFAFCVCICISYIWAHKSMINTTIAMLEIVIPISILYCAIFLFAFIKDEEDIKTIINIFLASQVFLVLYLIVVTPLSVWGTMDLGQNVGIHKNTIGVNLAWVSVICFYFVRSKNKGIKRKVYIVLFAVFVVISLVAGSRKALVILLAGIGLYFVFCEKNVKMLKNIGLAIVVIASLWIAVMNIPVLYEQVGARAETMIRTLTTSSSVSIEEDKSIWERSYYRQYALQMFTESPFYFLFGHGLDGFRTRMAEIGYSHVAYSHCNYTEMLANYGLIGFIIYYFYKIKIVIKAVLLKDKSKLVTLFMIVMGVGLVMEYGMVSYYDSFTQFCYVLSYCAIVKSSEIKEGVSTNKQIGANIA